MNYVCSTLGMLASLLTSTATATAQDVPRKPPVLTVSVFSHSVSLPTFRGLFKSPNFGLRVGTEFYHRNRPGSQLIQTLNIGAYCHLSLQNSLYVNTEFGYRKFFGGFYADGFVGIGGLGIRHLIPSYERTEMGEFHSAPRFMVRIMPSVSTGDCEYGLGIEHWKTDFGTVYGL